MSRPCLCDRCLIGAAWDRTQCRRCWNYHNDPRFRRKWGGPPLGEKVLNFALALSKHFLAGLPLVDDVTREARLAVCRGCEHYRDNSCEKCGCNLAVKAGWAEQKCPLRKWPDDNRQEH